MCVILLLFTRGKRDERGMCVNRKLGGREVGRICKELGEPQNYCMKFSF